MHTAIQICVFTALSLVPGEALIRRCRLIHLKRVYLPVALVDLSDYECGKCRVVSQEIEAVVGFWINVGDPA
jgi:hypothetical protein